jgi:putative endonuclease
LRYLATKGYETLERNYRTRHSEIDLIVRGEHALVFVEVKLRQGTEFGDPLEAVTPRKQAQVRLMAEQYLAERGDDFDEGFDEGFDEVRFDVVCILASGTGRPEICHVQDSF